MEGVKLEGDRGSTVTLHFARRVSPNVRMSTMASIPPRRDDVSEDIRLGWTSLSQHVCRMIPSASRQTKASAKAKLIWGHEERSRR